jgi:hypothetical protein
MAGRSLILALRLLMLIPFLGIMGYGLLMTKFGQEMQSGQGGFASNILMKVGAAWLDHSANKKRDAILDSADLNDDRVVYLERKFSLSELPGAAGGTLEGPRAEIAALAYAKQWGDRECEAMVASFATACSLGGAGGAIGDDGMVRVKVTLSFASDAPVGNTEGKDEASLVPQVIELTESRASVFDPADLMAERARLYGLTQKACDELRARLGTCVVQSVSFDEEPGEDGKVRLSAHANLASLGERVTVTSMLGLLNAKPAADQADPLAAASGFANAMIEANEALKAAEVPETPSADSLFDRANKPRFQNSQGGAKFVTPP